MILHLALIGLIDLNNSFSNILELDVLIPTTFKILKPSPQTETITDDLEHSLLYFILEWLPA